MNPTTDEQPGDWIDPAEARRLLLEYRLALKVKGGSEIERQIDKHTKQGISRKTIENWLNDPGSDPSSQTIKIVLRFLRTDHFQGVVPRTRDRLDADARLHRLGSALFDLQGDRSKDASELARLNVQIAGWWTQREGKGVILIEPVADHPFSKIYLFLDAIAPHLEHPPRGAGIVFSQAGDDLHERPGFPPLRPSPHGATFGYPQAGSTTDFAYAVRVWVDQDHREQSMKIVYRRDRFGEDLFLLFNPREKPGLFCLENFYRAEEASVAEFVRGIFKEWSREVIPHQ